jgi:hypothetical protein
LGRLCRLDICLRLEQGWDRKFIHLNLLFQSVLYPQACADQGDEEQFFTGLKPELSNCYADYFTTPEMEYTIQPVIGSDVVTGLIAPTCQIPNVETYTDGMKLTVQRP